MKLLSATQMREADQITLRNQNISSTELMERAAGQCFNFIHERLQGAPVPFRIFCGLGNNGGDGLAIARMLIKHGYVVHIYIVNFSDNRSADFMVNYNLLQDMGNWPQQLRSEADFPVIAKDDIIIDAIFGIGLSKPMPKWVCALVKRINEAKAFTVAIDIPSGLCTDRAPFDTDAVIYANTVLTFQCPKLVFYLPETGVYVQDIEVLDIGLDTEYLDRVEPVGLRMGKQEILRLYQPRERFAHKGTYGHVLTIGGSYGKIGSMILSTKAGLCSGAGLVTAYIPKCGYTSVQTAVPEAMVITSPEDSYLNQINYEEIIKPTVIAVGMGMGTEVETQTAFLEFLKKCEMPIVIDADGLNCLAKNPEGLSDIPNNSVLTPHPGELERLIGNWADDFDKLNKAKAFSKEFNCILVIKGANTIIVHNDKLYCNSTGNPGMASAGMGDVLSGIISSLIAQRYDPLQAAIMGVYLHGSAADIAVRTSSYQGLTAGIVIETIGKAFLDLFVQPETQPDPLD